MQPIQSGTQITSQEPVTALSWLTSWHGHIVSEAAKAFEHIQNSVLHFFNEPKRQVTPISRLPSAVVATGIVRMLAVRDASGFFDFLCDDERLALLKHEPRIINQLVRAHKGDVDAIPAVWRKALNKVVSDVRSLDLHDIALRPIDIKRIVQLFPNLKEMNLENCSLTDQCIYYLRNTYLETLKFDKNEEITEFGINWLSKMPAAKTITLPPFTNSVDLLQTFFEDLLGKRAFWHAFPKTLENLTVYCDHYPLCYSRKHFFSFLQEHCPNLKTIIIPDTIYKPQDVVNGLKTLASLEKLIVNCTGLTDGQISELTLLVHLKTLEIKSMWNRVLTNAIFDSLAKFKELEHLLLTGLIEVTAEGIDKLSTLSNFRSLTLSSQNLNNNSLNAIAKLRQLQILDLSNCLFSERMLPNTMAALCALPELHTLSITVRLTNSFLPHASGLVKLQKLKLEAVLSVQDAQLTSLQGMPELTELEITKCTRLTDQALTTLIGCKKLKKVKLTRNNFTAAAIASFKLARPDIQLIN